MAENTRRYGQGAVYGSLAYDFNNPALYPEYTEEAQWHVEHQTQNPVREEEQVAAQAAVKNLQAISPVSVMGLAEAAIFCQRSSFFFRLFSSGRETQREEGKATIS